MKALITLEDDLADVDRLRQERRQSFEEVLQAVKTGLPLLESRPGDPAPSYTQSVLLGPCLLPDLDSVSRALAAAEGETFR